MHTQKVTDVTNNAIHGWANAGENNYRFIKEGETNNNIAV